MELKLIVPDDLLDKIEESNGELVLEASYKNNGAKRKKKKKNGRLTAISDRQSAASKRTSRSRFLRSQDEAGKAEKEIVSLWNNSAVITEDGERNLPVAGRGKQACWKKLKDLFNAGVDPRLVKQEVERYLGWCREEKNINEGKNYAYKSLYGLLKKLEEYYVKDIGILHWHNGIFDEYPEYTEHLANEFAKRFLGKSTYPLKDDDRAHYSFVVCREHIFEEIDAGRTDLSFTDVVKEILDCAEETTSKSYVHPSFIANVTFKMQIFPKYMKQRRLTWRS